MSEKIISFDRHKAKHSELKKLHEEGYKVICPLCKSEIFFSENAGSWCSKNPNHYETHIYKASVRDEMRENLMRRDIEETREIFTKKGYMEEEIEHEISQRYFSQPHSRLSISDDGKYNVLILNALPEELNRHIQFAISNYERHGYKHIETTDPVDNEGYDIRQRVYIRFAKK